jgi:magnesium transporter
MITVRKSTETVLETIDQPSPGSWLNVVAPTPAEIAELQALLGVPQDSVTYPLDLDERARTEKENGALLIVLRVPAYQGEKADIPYITVPLGIIVTEDHIATVSHAETGVIQESNCSNIKRAWSISPPRSRPTR